MKQDIFLFTGNLKANITQYLLSRKNGLLGNHKRVDQTNKVFEIPFINEVLVSTTYLVCILIIACSYKLDRNKKFCCFTRYIELTRFIGL